MQLVLVWLEMRVPAMSPGLTLYTGVSMVRGTVHVCVHRESGSVVVWIFTKQLGSLAKLHLWS